MVVEIKSTTLEKKSIGSAAVGSTPGARMDEIKEAHKSARSIDDIGYQIGVLGDQVIGVEEKINRVGQSINTPKGT